MRLMKRFNRDIEGNPLWVSLEEEFNFVPFHDLELTWGNLGDRVDVVSYDPKCDLFTITLRPDTITYMASLEQRTKPYRLRGWKEL